MARRMIVATGNRNKLIEIREILADTGLEFVSMKDAGVRAQIVENGTSFEENAAIKARTVAAASGQMAIADDSGLVIDCLCGEPGIYSARYLGEDTPYDLKNRILIQRVNDFCRGYASSETGKRPARCAGSEFLRLDSLMLPDPPEPAGSTPDSLKTADRRLPDAEAACGKPESSGTTEQTTDDSKKEAVSLPGAEPDGTPGPLRSARFVCACAAAWPDGTVKTVTGVMEGRIAYRQQGENGFGYDPIFYLPEYGMTSAQLTPDAKNAVSHRGKAFETMRAYLAEHVS